MTIRGLVIDADAVPLLQLAGAPDESWFSEFAVSDPRRRVRSRVVGDKSIILTDKASPDSKVLAIDLGADNFFLGCSGSQQGEILRRLMVAAQNIFSKSMNIPYAWRPFKSGSRISFNALPYSGDLLRLEIETSPNGAGDIFVFSCTAERRDLLSAKSNVELYEDLRAAFDEVSKEGWSDGENVSSPGAINLSDETFFHSNNEIDFEEWVVSKLTAQQRAFVEADSGKPIRLRGVAGTGKTLALAIRALVSMRSAVQAQVAKRIVFFTHSASTAAATVALIGSLGKV